VLLKKLPTLPKNEEAVEGYLVELVEEYSVENEGIVGIGSVGSLRGPVAAYHNIL
jgi:hypothetical protein